MIIADSPGAVNAAAGGARQQFTPVGEGATAGVRERSGSGRGERIRTSGLYVPNVALYQAKLHPEAEKQRGDESAPFLLCRLELSLDRKVR